MMTQSTPEEQLLRRGRILQTTVGCSMEPMLHHRRSLVEIQRLTAPPKRHDVVLYRRSSGDYVLHRVLRVKGDCYRIRGDNCNWTETVPASQLLGVLTAFSPDGGDMIPVTDKRYQSYVRKRCFILPLKNAALWLRRLPGRCVRKIKKIFHSGKE